MTYNPENMDLTDFYEEYSNAPEPTDNGGFGKIPDGKYEVTVVGAKCKDSKAGNPMLEWTLRIDGGPHAGRMLWRYNMLSTQQNHTWLKGDLKLCGFGNRPVRCEELVGLRLRVTKKTKGEFENIYINELLGAGDASATQPDPPSGNGKREDMPAGVKHHNYPEDEIPF